MKDIRDNSFIVAGLGKSGIGTANLLEKCNAEYVLYDGNVSVDERNIREQLINKDVKIILGELDEKTIEDADVMIISPGVPIDAPFVNRVRQMGIKISGEIELAFQTAKGKLAAITGTNGKTTTTALVGEIFANQFKESYVVGNIGTPYTSVSYETTDDSVTVAEISSFQLETIDTFKPNVSAVLNITPDHLNRHYTMENYANVKLSIAKNQTSKEVCVLNYEDEYLREGAKKIPAKIIYFSSKRKLEEGVFLDGEDIIYKYDGINEKIINVHEMKLVGIHNVENVMAAIAIAVNMNVSLDILRESIRNFKAVAHRIEYVAVKNGVTFYNDSKGTNTDASTKAIQAMSKPTVLIAGGYDKGVTFDEWVDSFGGKIKALVLMGKTRDKINETARERGFNNIYMVDSLKEAVEKSYELANDEEVVLLSPACASWDMFDSYEQRGDMFKDFVNEL